jgi:hypothetical protein
MLTALLLWGARTVLRLLLLWVWLPTRWHLACLGMSTAAAAVLLLWALVVHSCSAGGPLLAAEALRHLNVCWLAGLYRSFLHFIAWSVLLLCHSTVCQVLLFSNSI